MSYIIGLVLPIKNSTNNYKFKVEYGDLPNTKEQLFEFEYEANKFRNLLIMELANRLTKHELILLDKMKQKAK